MRNPVLRPHQLQLITGTRLGLQQHFMHRRCGELERRHQTVTQQHPRQEQAGRQIAHAHRLTRKRQQRTAQVPAFIGGHQQHLETLRRLARIIQMLDQHRFRAARQQRPGHRQAVEQRLRLASGEAVQFQLVRAHDVRHRRRLFQQEVADFGRHTAAFFRMTHHRIAQVQGLWIDCLDALDATENRPALRRAAQITGKHCVAVAQLADGSNAFDQLGNLVRRQHFTGPLPVLGVIGKLHGVERPDVHPDPLHRKNRGAVAGVAEDHMGLNGEQMRRTFHSGYSVKRLKFKPRSMRRNTACTTDRRRS